MGGEQLKAEDRKLMFQSLFRPASTSLLKEDALPLAWAEHLTKLTKTD